MSLPHAFKTKRAPLRYFVVSLFVSTLLAGGFFLYSPAALALLEPTTTPGQETPGDITAASKFVEVLNSDPDASGFGGPASSPKAVKIGGVSEAYRAFLQLGNNSISDVSQIRQSLSNNAITITVPKYNNTHYFPGIVWSSANQYPSLPKVALWGQMTDTGSKLFFGTSNDYSKGITNTALAIDQSGDAEFSGLVKAPKFLAGSKWLFSDTGGGADEWLRLYNSQGTGYYGGIAMNQLWVNNQAWLLGGVHFNNSGVDQLNAISINDPGEGEGISWAGTGAGWVIDVAAPSRTGNADGDLWLYGTKNVVRVARPLSVQNGTGASTLYADVDKGFVGVGTAVPSVPLEVNSPVGDKGLRITAAGKNTAIALHVAGGDYGYLSLGGGTELRGANTSSFGGNVGIGTTTPGAKLEVKSGDILINNSHSTLGFMETALPGSSPYTQIQTYGNGSWVGSGLKLTQLVDGVTKDVFAINNGNVGIGTLRPGRKLDVVGSTSVGTTSSDYLPGGYNWNYTLLLNGLDTTSIGFHDSGSNVGSIRFKNNLFTIGENDGWGIANAYFPGSVTVGGTFAVSTFSASKLELSGSGDIIRQNGVDWFYRDNNDLQWWQTRGANGIIRIGNDAGGNFSEFDVKANKSVFEGGVGIGTSDLQGQRLRIDGDLGLPSGDLNLSGATDKMQDAPWYGLGFNNNTADRWHGPGPIVQLGGYFGLQFAEQGAIRMAIRAGNVGIGTTQPGEKLDVAGAIRGGGPIYTTSPGGYAQTSLQQWGLLSPGSMYIEPSPGSTLYLTDQWSGTGVLYVRFGRTVFPTGNVGIGTESPGNKLTVIDSGSKNTSNTSAWVYSGNGFDTTSQSLGSTSLLVQNSSSRANGSNELTNIGLVATAYGGQKNYAIIVPQGAGRVGIGTSAPIADLDVNGNIRATSAVQTSQLCLGLNNPSCISKWDQMFQWTPNGSSIGYTRGWVGIGTTSPGAPLHVKTSLDSALNLQTTDNGWLYTQWFDKNDARRVWMGLDGDLSWFNIQPENGTRGILLGGATRVDTLNFRGPGGDSGQGAQYYGIYQESGPWTHPYPDLRIQYHTGIKYDAYAGYGGHRFYTGYDGTGNPAGLQMSIDNGVTIENNLSVKGSTIMLRKDAAWSLGPTLLLQNGGGNTGAESRIDMATYDFGGSNPNFRLAVTDENYGANVNIQTKTTGAMGNALVSRMYIKSDGLVGIGTNDPKQILHANGSSEIYSTGTGAGFKFSDRGASPWSNHDWVWYSIGDVARFWRSGVGDLMVVKTNGNVGIGTADPQYRLDVRGGDINVGNTAFISPKEKVAFANERAGLDVAEVFETNDEVEMGDVLVVSSDGKKLEKTSYSYDARVIGVVSGSPAVVFEGSELKIGAKPFRFIKGTKPPVALAGRVPVKVSTENGVIKPGDFLTTSSTPGVAMKATDGGATLGIALEPYDGAAENQILVFVNIGERNTSTVIQTFQEQLEDLKTTIHGLRQRLDSYDAKNGSKRVVPLW